MKGKIMKDLVPKDETFQSNSLYFSYDQNDPTPPPFIFIPDFDIIHSMILAAAN
jgi:hypothetical protein